MLMFSIPFTAVLFAVIVALVAPAKVNDVITNSSAEHGLKRPAVIHVKSFSISKSATNSGAISFAWDFARRAYSDSEMHTSFLSFDSKGASGYLPGAVAVKNPYVAAAKLVTSEREPEQEANTVPKRSRTRSENSWSPRESRH